MTIDLTRPYDEYTKYEKCAYFLVSDKLPLRILRNRLEALKAIVDKVNPNSTFTSSELDVQPMGLACICDQRRACRFWKGIAPIQLVEQRDCFVNVYENFYIKAYYNVYKLAWSVQEIKDFIDAICKTYGIYLPDSGT